MRYEILKSKGHSDEWRVEAINMEVDGDCYVTLFCGPLAQERAQEYVSWKMGESTKKEVINMFNYRDVLFDLEQRKKRIEELIVSLTELDI